MNLSGLHAAITTPFSEDEQIAFDQLDLNFSKWLSQPLDGMVVLGTSGEAAYLTLEERTALWKHSESILHAAGKRFIAGAGGETTRDTIKLVQLAADLGADAAVVITPSFFKPSQEALLAHYRGVADASPIPILLYNYPAFTGVEISADTAIALADHPRIIGIKDSSANIIKLARILAARPDFQVFSGIAAAVYSFLGLGAAGAILALANIAATPLRQILDAFQSNRLEEARRLQLSLADLSEALEIRHGIPGLKYAMDQLGLYGGPPRRPLLPITSQARDEIDRLLIGLRASVGSAQ